MPDVRTEIVSAVHEPSRQGVCMGEIMNDSIGKKLEEAFSLSADGHRYRCRRCQREVASLREWERHAVSCIRELRDMERKDVPTPAEQLPIADWLK